MEAAAPPPVAASAPLSERFAVTRARLATSRGFAVFESSLLLLEGLAVAAAANGLSRALPWAAARALFALLVQAGWFWGRVGPLLGGRCSLAPRLPSPRAATLLAGLAAVAVATREQLSLANVWRNEQPDWSGALQLVLMGPLHEELLFRGAFFLPMIGRMSGGGGGGGGSVAVCAALSGLVFALFHAGNLAFPLRYRAAQMCFGAVCGACYAVSLAREGSLFETVLLHAANNALAALTPVALVQQHLLAPRVALPLAAVLLLHLQLLL